MPYFVDLGEEIRLRAAIQMAGDRLGLEERETQGGIGVARDQEALDEDFEDGRDHDLQIEEMGRDVDPQLDEADNVQGLPMLGDSFLSADANLQAAQDDGAQEV